MAPYDEEELDRLRAQGVMDPEDDPSVLIQAPGATVCVFFNRVPEPKIGKNRLHLDLRTDDVAAETARLVGIGARRLADVDDWVTLADPEGNEFDLMPR